MLYLYELVNEMERAVNEALVSRSQRERDALWESGEIGDFIAEKADQLAPEWPTPLLELASISQWLAIDEVSPERIGDHLPETPSAIWCIRSNLVDHLCKEGEQFARELSNKLQEAGD